MENRRPVSDKNKTLLLTGRAEWIASTTRKSVLVDSSCGVGRLKAHLWSRFRSRGPKDDWGNNTPHVAVVFDDGELERITPKERELIYDDLHGRELPLHVPDGDATEPGEDGPVPRGTIVWRDGTVQVDLADGLHVTLLYWPEGVYLHRQEIEAVLRQGLAACGLGSRTSPCLV